VSSRGDVPEVERRGAPYDLLHRGRFASDERGGVGFEELEEAAVLDERRLDRLRDASAPVAVLQRREKAEVVDHRERRGERAEVVLLAERVDAVLDADCRIVLQEGGGRYPERGHAAVRGGRGKPGDVENRAAADGNEVRV